jgi:hypothetical protein
MHRTPSSLRGRLDINNLRTSETIIMNQGFKKNYESINDKLWDYAHYTQNGNYAILDGA